MTNPDEVASKPSLGYFAVFVAAVSVLALPVVDAVALEEEPVVAVDDVAVADVSVNAAVSPPVPELLSCLHEQTKRVATIKTRASFRICTLQSTISYLFAQAQARRVRARLFANGDRRSSCND